MGKKKVEVNFTNDFKGELIAQRGTAHIGIDEGTLEPYDMLLGALASCLYATFLEIVMKKHIGFETAHIEVVGEKREEVPTVLKYVNVIMTIKGAEKESGVIKSMELATKYCSIYETISKVAEMNWEVIFG